MSIKAMKQALEALEEGNKLCLAAFFKTSVIFDPAITALRTAIEQAEKQEPVAWANPNDLTNFDMKVRTNGGPLHTVPLYTTPPGAQRQWVGLTDEEVKKVHTNAGVTYLVPADYDRHLFTHMTDVQIMKVSRAIEAKLREKNGGQA